MKQHSRASDGSCCFRLLFGWWLLGCCGYFPTLVTAIYKDDVGLLDFSVATAGHGAVGWTHYHKNVVVTTDVLVVPAIGGTTASTTTTSCYVAGRYLDSGDLAWRRNVCSVADDANQAHSIAAGNREDLYTVDNSGIARSWSIETGDLLWDAKIGSASSIGSGNAPPKVFFVDAGSGDEYVAVSTGSGELVFLEAVSGAIMDTIAAPNVKGGHRVEWLSAHSAWKESSTIHLAYAGVEKRATGGSSSTDFYVGTYEIGGSFKSGGAKPKAKNVVPASVTSVTDGKIVQVWAVTASGLVILASNGNVEVFPPSYFLESWSAVVGVHTTSSPHIVSVSGTSNASAEPTMEAFEYIGANSSWKRLHTGDQPKSAVAFARNLELAVATPLGRSVEVYNLRDKDAQKITGDVFGADGDGVSVVSVLEGPKDSATILIGTQRGSTKLMSLTPKGGKSTEVKVLWEAEEGLSSLSSAIILDASHLGSDDLVEEKNVLVYRLSMAGRLKSQVEEISTMLGTANGLIGDGTKNYRDHLFGFLKVAALLSPKSHRMWGMSTAGTDRGSIRWSLDLPKTALWHSMVHGTTNAAKAAHGIHGDTHSREILILSASPDRVDWMCIDGTSGAINAQDSIPVSAPIRQVVPVYGTSTGGCRQASLLLGEDLGLTVVPADAQTNALIQKQLHKTPNGLYTHKIDTVANKLESYRVSSEGDNGFAAFPVGLASFDGEQIVKVAYPMRHEDMQSMSTILGDNSLLLKYINPHMAVVVTMLSRQDDQSVTEVATALEKEKEGKQRKPKGAGAPGSSTQEATISEELPNMYVNLVDTVSGRVLYRHSHSNVDSDKKVSVVISENWVVYTYVNEKTRRTEIGVLTLHEGMIEPKGLTYFARPEQSSSFSSFDARESKPVVLSKVYTFPKSVTALGVTSTKQGISRQNILIGSSDGSLTTINKMILETRRPVGEVKPEEKKEGLIPYKEMIPNSPLFSLNYNQTTEPFQSIVSSTTALESQSLVFGFGGPDLFFSRTSPTKGFDLLPETFNKMLVGAATIGIVVALLVVQRMGKKKALKQGWS